MIKTVCVPGAKAEFGIDTWIMRAILDDTQKSASNLLE